MSNNKNRSFSMAIAPANQSLPAVEVVLMPAPEKATPGSASTNAGEIVLLKDGDKFKAMISLGETKKIITDTYRIAGGGLVKWLRKNGIEQAWMDVSPFATCGVSNALVAFMEGLHLGAYEFKQYKSKKSEDSNVSLLLVNALPQVQDLLNRVEIITTAVNLSRSWAHEPANIINPVTLAARVIALGAEFGLKVTILDDTQLQSMNAGGIFSVGKGSQSGPRMIVIEHPGKGGKAGQKPVVLVGKAITFDTGGYSLKDTANIQGMKYDKCGGVNVAAIMSAVAALQLDIPVIGIICAAENMVSDHAYRPDDILTTLSGKTVEIITTDAEGRLVLADGLTYAQQQYSPRAIIDMATLTGGVVTALGRVRAGIMANNDELVRSLTSAGDYTHERLWSLPLDEDYFNNIKGDDADLKNSGGREGHPIMGGIFLKQFVDDAIPWAHLDIAGVADSPKDLPYSPKGATGFGVRLILQYLETL